MTLQKLAELYKRQFIDCKYIIHTEDDTLVLNGQPDNFMHLIGVEKYLSPNTKKTQFYYDCLNNKYSTIENIINQIQKQDDKDMTSIKKLLFL